MNFFESQDRARAITKRLVILFVLAMVTLIVMTNLLVLTVIARLGNEYSLDSDPLASQFDWQLVVAVSLGVVVVVIVGSLYRTKELSVGGKVVAELLGAHLLQPDTSDPKQRTLLNVVEEIAIASSTPVPPVYLLESDSGINAFAAGLSPRDAVIGVTRGAIEHLNRDQLQGVIAHEFSHIFNGDMRMNIRLMGVLYGLLVVGLIGYRMQRLGRRARDRNTIVLGLGLIVVGYVGMLFSGLIKAAVSRQREYLADACAVQFTRNSHGIAGALRRIGGSLQGSEVMNPNALEISHAFFADAISGFMKSQFATHPPLRDRIRRIDPQWDGVFDYIPIMKRPNDQDVVPKPDSITAGRLTDDSATGADKSDIARAIDSMGHPTPEAIAYAQALMAALPEAIKMAAHEPYGARALIYLLLLDQAHDHRSEQLKLLRERAESDVFLQVQRLMPEIDALKGKHRQPLIDMAMPALKQLSTNQYVDFRDKLVALIGLDSKVTLLEWSLQKVLFSHLDRHFFKPPAVAPIHAGFESIKQELALFLALLAYAGHDVQVDAERAFRAAVRELELEDLPLHARTEIRLPALDQAGRKLMQLRPVAKKHLLDACVVSVMVDQHVAESEVDLLRAFSAVLDCPMPYLARTYWA